MKSNLQHPFLTVRRGGIVSYGGNQAWFESGYMKKSGCGVICSTNVLIYLSMYRSGCRTEFMKDISIQPALENTRSEDSISMKTLHNVIREEDYRYLAEQFHRKYFTVVPYLGMPGCFVTGGLNRYFRKYKIPLRAYWGVRKFHFWDCVQEMLEKDIPVILGIGVNFPFPWTQHRLAFYVKGRDGSYEYACGVKGHFVTITAMNECWIRVSSWGKEYYIKKKEYMEYTRKYSTSLTGNLVYMKELKKQ